MKEAERGIDHAVPAMEPLMILPRRGVAVDGRDFFEGDLVQFWRNEIVKSDVFQGS